jgi:hypothetical protein
VSFKKETRTNRDLPASVELLWLLEGRQRCANPSVDGNAGIKVCCVESNLTGLAGGCCRDWRGNDEGRCVQDGSVVIHRLRNGVSQVLIQRGEAKLRG